MKKFLFSILLLPAIFFAQKYDYQVNKFGKKPYKVGNKLNESNITLLDIKKIIQFDSINNITILTLAKNKFIIPDKWELFDYKNYTYDILVSHCPTFVNSDNIILEFGMYNKDTFLENSEIKSSNVHTLKSKFVKLSINNKILLEKFNAEKNYYLLKVLTSSKVKKGELITYYELIGVKNNKVYNIALQNFNEDVYENLEEFIISIYDIN